MVAFRLPLPFRWPKTAKKFCGWKDETLQNHNGTRALFGCQDQFYVLYLAIQLVVVVG